jgi:hypothetical protein
VSKFHAVGLDKNRLSGKLTLECPLLLLGAEVGVNIALPITGQLTTPANVKMPTVRAGSENLHGRKMESRAHATNT